jgi:ParB family chromosome partitioning protein
MALKRGLGRGLDAILEKPEVRDGIQLLPLWQLQPNRHQPRNAFDKGGLEELSQSIQAQGIIQPLVASPGEAGKYVIVAGERRWRAAKMAGLREVPVIVREIEDDRQLLELALVENLQREDLNAVEEAEAFQALRENFRLSQDQVGQRVGKSRTTITNSLRLLRLGPEVLDLVRDGALTAGQARPLLGIESKGAQLHLARRAVQEELSARQVEAIVRRESGASRATAAKSRTDVHASAAADALTRSLQAKVEIVRRGKKGVVKIHFHSEEELMGIYERLMKTATVSVAESEAETAEERQD